MTIIRKLDIEYRNVCCNFKTEGQKFNYVFDILLRFSKFHLVSDKKLPVDAICQLFDFSKSNFTDLQSAIDDLYYSFKNQAIDISLESDSVKDINQLQADCDRCLVALTGILFQLRAVSGRESQLVEKDLTDSEMGVGESSVFLVTRAMHEQLAKIASSLKDECHKTKALSTLADAIEKHQQKFCDTINSLLG